MSVQANNVEHIKKIACLAWMPMNKWIQTDSRMLYSSRSHGLSHTASHIIEGHWNGCHVNWTHSRRLHVCGLSSAKSTVLLLPLP